MADDTTTDSPFTWDSARDDDRRQIPIGTSWTNDMVDNPCFGCRQDGPPGLRMSFTRTGDDTVESTWTCGPEWAGWKTVVHGGIQAALLDEVTGTVAWVVHSHEPDMIPNVTTRLDVRFRRPAPTGVPLAIRARLDRIEDLDHFVTAEIVDPSGTVCTTADAVLRRLG